MDTDHAGHRERIRKRFAENGLTGFAEHEILELLLTFAIPRVNTNPQAHRLIDTFGSLNGVLEASQKELESVQGIGPQASTLLSMLLPILRVYERNKALPRPRLSTYADIVAFCRTLFLGKNWEEFYVLCLDADLNLLSAKRIARGTPTEVNALPRLVLEELLQSHAAGAVITHNHPSANASPSQEDVDVTLTIDQLLKGVGIRLYDHVLIAGEREYSFFAHRWLEPSAMRMPFSEEDESPPQLAAEHPQRMLPARRKKERQNKP